jgi:integrase
VVTEGSGKHRKNRAERLRVLTPEMQTRLGEFELGLHGIREDTKEDYVNRILLFGNFLVERGKTFDNADSKEIDLFLSGFPNPGTKNNFIISFRAFYSVKPKLTKHLKLYDVELAPINPADILSPEEVMQIAQEAGKKRDLYKIAILTLYESCCRISELTALRREDVTFQSVNDKEGKRKLIATLHFMRAKGGVKKQPIVLVMFAAELKRWVDAQKGSSFLFPSPSNKDEHISGQSIGEALWNAGQRLNIKKPLHNHWLRHSGLSYFANQKNYNEQLLMWRGGWVNTEMCARYIHSGGELEAKSYLERSGLVVEGKNKEVQISSKTCPHCQQPNPYTNDVCDLCAMPLDLTLYKAEIEKRRNIEQLYDNIQKISNHKLSEQQEMELSKRTDTVLALLELGREDLAREYMEKLLEHWTKAFLTSSF